MRWIQYGDANVVVCGGAEASVSPLAMAGFAQYVMHWTVGILKSNLNVVKSTILTQYNYYHTHIDKLTQD